MRRVAPAGLVAAAAGLATLAAADRPYVSAARDAARWIEASAVRTARGTAGPADPRDPKTVRTDLYSGGAGVVLFYAERYRWTQAENRVEPNTLVAQPGYMQGAAGLGMLLLHADEYARGRVPAIRFPDSPF